VNRRLTLLIAVALVVVAAILILILRARTPQVLALTAVRTATYTLSYPQDWKRLPAGTTGSPAAIPAVILGPPDRRGEPTGEVVLRKGRSPGGAGLTADVDEFKRAAQLLHLGWKMNASTEPTVAGARSSFLVDTEYSIEGGDVQVRELDLFALAPNGTLYHVSAIGEVGSVTGEDLKRIVTGFGLEAGAGNSATP
jgi:hypothetical protein